MNLIFVGAAELASPRGSTAFASPTRGVVLVLSGGEIAEDDRDRTHEEQAKADPAAKALLMAVKAIGRTPAAA